MEKISFAVNRKDVKIENQLDLNVWETAVHLAVAGGVFDGVSFFAVLFPTRCLG